VHQESQREYQYQETPRLKIIQQIVDHVRSEGLQTLVDKEKGITHYGLEIRLRVEGQAPTSVVEGQPAMVNNLEKQLVCGVLEGIFGELLHLMSEQQRMLNEHLEKDPSLLMVADLGDQIFHMLVDLPRYWSQPLPGRDEIDSANETPEYQIPITELLPAHAAHSTEENAGGEING